MLDWLVQKRGVVGVEVEGLGNLFSLRLFFPHYWKPVDLQLQRFVFLGAAPDIKFMVKAAGW